MSKIPILWFGDGGETWGKDWLTHLFPENTFKFVTYGPHETPEVAENCIVCTNVGASNAYIDKLHRHGSRFGVILLSDECLTEEMAYVADENCVFLARNYAHPLVLNNPKSFIFGLGWKNGFREHAKPEIPATKRGLVWSFAGSLKLDRANALNSFEKIQPNRTWVCKQFNDPDYLGVKEYADLLSDSVFALAPGGGASNDSFRIYEALEAGAIPIVLKNSPPLTITPSYWHAVFRGESTLPFILADSWEDAAVKAQMVLDSGQLDLIQESCIDFWNHWKTSWKRMFATALDLLNHPSEI